MQVGIRRGRFRRRASAVHVVWTNETLAVDDCGWQAECSCYANNA